MTVTATGNMRRFFRLGLIPGIIAIIATLIIELGLVLTLPVFTTSLGLWILLTQFLTATALLLILVVVLSWAFMIVEQQRGHWTGWIVYYVILGLACFVALAAGLSNGLNFDVKYQTFSGKAGINFLNLQYLNGAVVYAALLLTVFFILSDPRIKTTTGPEGKRHVYMHSKFLGILRLLRRSNLGTVMRSRRYRYYDTSSTERPGVGWDVGETMDHAILSKNGKLEWNDWFSVSSPNFLVWMALKFFIALGIAFVIANDVALRFNVIQNYLGQTNTSWLSQIQSYFNILSMRLAGTYQVSSTFGIDNAFTFEVFKFILSILGLAFTIVGIRLFISVLANAMVGLSNRVFGMSRLALSNLFIIFSLPLIYTVLSSGAWVYDVGSSFILWTLVLILAGCLFVVGLTRSRRVFHIQLTRVKAALILVIVIISIIALPAYGTFLRNQSGQYIKYQWDPAYVPTIQYTRWAYGVDNINNTNLSLITSSTNQSILDHIRIFTADSARLNMKPLVGVNWMSIDNAPVDIIYYKGNEYWVSTLQLVEANVANDPDVWRTQHLLLTHSEKILAVNGSTAQPVDMSKVWNLTQTPQIYYGEGGLWSNVDEVYLNIPGFNETHLTGYVGPASYNGPPDYTYNGFWLYWKFFWQGRFDFASGNYGNIKALEYRDIDSRTSQILLPNMQTDPDPYPVVDPQGNLYLLHWVWINWQSPSDFADYPDHNQTSILRLFAAVLTNMKTGQITGFFNPNMKQDYVTSFYRTMYPQWNQQMPSWLVPQLRYPETYFDMQQEVYNFYFQTDPLQWQRNVFFQNTEDTRFIITPINGKLTWAAVRLVEIFQSPSQNLAGLYVAPAGSETGTVYLIRFPEGTTVIGPNSAQSAVSTDPTVTAQLTLHPDWTPGNMLLYSINGRLIYVIPYYGTATAGTQNLTVPVMVAVVDASTKVVGSQVIQHPNSASEVQNAPTLAVSNMGLAVGTRAWVNGTLTRNDLITVGGFSHLVVTVTPSSGPAVVVVAKVETLGEVVFDKLYSTPLNTQVHLQVDTTVTPYNVLAVQ